jgi:hypothetical protein
VVGASESQKKNIGFKLKAKVEKLNSGRKLHTALASRAKHAYPSKSENDLEDRAYTVRKARSREVNMGQKMILNAKRQDRLP